MHTENNCDLPSLSKAFYIKNFYRNDENEIVNNGMLFIQKCKKALDKSFEDVSDKIKMVGGKQNFELHLNESEKNAVYKLANLRDIQIKEVDFDNLYVEN